MIQIDIFYFLLSLFIGFFLVYTTTPKPDIVIKYPTLDDIDNTTYIDEKNMCYKYKPIEVECEQ